MSSSNLPQKTQKSLQNLDPLANLMLILLGSVSIGLILGLLALIVGNTKVYQLRFAAGDPTGESYILGQAIAKTIEQYTDNIEIELVTTKGTSENLEKLEANTVDFATTQADIPVGPSARALAVLYRDLFQLIVKDNSGINQFTDLKGKTIGLQPRGGQFQSFLDVAKHYGLSQKDFKFVGNSDNEADVAFQNNQVQAVFRVWAPGNQGIAILVQHHQGRLIAIEQAMAMQLKYPAFQPAEIPQGAYQGVPAVPDRDLPTIAVDRLLLAHEKVPEKIVRQIVTILNERQQDIADRVTLDSAKPLVVGIHDPRQAGGLDVPIHAGALNYYDRNTPSFVQQNADLLGLLLTLALLLGSWVWELKNWVERSKKDFADQYIERAVHLMQDKGSPQGRQKSLDKVFREAASHLVGERISQESFRTFNEAYKTARETIEREKTLALEAQREIAVQYIKQLIDLLQTRQSRKTQQIHLDEILAKASADLANNRISEESFRTFVEAYKTIRDAIDRRTS